MPWLIHQKADTVARGLMNSSLFVVERNAKNAKSILLEMPENDIAISFRTEWRSKDADGQLCEICDAPIYFPRAWDIEVWWEESKLFSADICDSCHEMGGL
jgi:hypothetical protein